MLQTWGDKFSSGLQGPFLLSALTPCALALSSSLTNHSTDFSGVSKMCKVCFCHETFIRSHILCLGHPFKSFHFCSLPGTYYWHPSSPPSSWVYSHLFFLYVSVYNIAHILKPRMFYSLTHPAEIEIQQRQRFGLPMVFIDAASDTHCDADSIFVKYVKSTFIWCPFWLVKWHVCSTGSSEWDSLCYIWGPSEFSFLFQHTA